MNDLEALMKARHTINGDLCGGILTVGMYDPGLMKTGEAGRGDSVELYSLSFVWQKGTGILAIPLISLAPFSELVELLAVIVKIENTCKAFNRLTDIYGKHIVSMTEIRFFEEFIKEDDDE